MDLETKTLLSNELDTERFGQSWTIKKIIPEFQTTLIYGDEGSYKTFVAINIAIQVQNGFSDLEETKKTGQYFTFVEKIKLDSRNEWTQFTTFIQTQNQWKLVLKSLVFVTKHVLEVNQYCLNHDIGF